MMLPEKKQILVVDDEANLRRVLAAQLARDGYEVHTAEDGEAGLALLASTTSTSSSPTCACRRSTGWSCSAQALRDDPELPVVMLTAHGTVDNAVEALKTGAFDYITKPFDQDEVRADRQEGAAHARPRRAPRRRAKTPREGARRALRHHRRERRPSSSVYAILERVADTPTTVLITGESGTGKELVARALHENSSAQATSRSSRSTARRSPRT